MLLQASVALGLLASAASADEMVSWITKEKQIALEKVLNNIGPDGSEVAGAAAGIVVASPSKSYPDCKSSLPCPVPLPGRRICHSETNTGFVHQTFTHGPATPH